MREIKFRGKREDNGEWVYGDLYRHDPPLQCVVPENYIPEQTKNYILKTAFADWNMPRQVEYIEVIPETIGQYTGMKDKNGKDIYEDDVVRAWSQGTMATGKVERRVDGLWIMFPAYQNKQFWGLCPNHCGETSVEVIGNIHGEVTE